MNNAVPRTAGVLPVAVFGVAVYGFTSGFRAGMLLAALLALGAALSAAWLIPRRGPG